MRELRNGGGSTASVRLCPEQVDNHTLLRGDLTESVSVESLFITGRFNLRKVRTCCQHLWGNAQYDSGPSADTGNTQRVDKILLAVSIDQGKSLKLGQKTQQSTRKVKYYTGTGSPGSHGTESCGLRGHLHHSLSTGLKINPMEKQFFTVDTQLCFVFLFLY